MAFFPDLCSLLLCKSEFLCDYLKLPYTGESTECEIKHIPRNAMEIPCFLEKKPVCEFVNLFACLLFKGGNYLGRNIANYGVIIYKLSLYLK